MTPDPAPLGDAPDVLSQRRAMLAGLGGLAAGALLASTANAGPLTPPPGPIASTPGPEPRIPINQTNTPGTSDSLFRITEPGSYYLTGNIIGQAGMNGIEIVSSGVTLDLMGFSLQGVTGALSGVFMAGFRRGITIRNGSVHWWPNDGLRIAIDSGLIESINAFENGGWGINDTGGYALHVRGCSAYTNRVAGTSGIQSGGIKVSNGAVVESCQARSNEGIGFQGGLGCVFAKCVAISNEQTGFFLEEGNIISGCSATTNGLGGIRVISKSLVLNNMCSGNDGQAGIFCSGSDCRIEDNNCVTNFEGIRVSGSGNFIARNTCSFNASQNWNIASGNVCLVVLAATSTAILGNSGGTSPGSTNPYANFTY